jgi:hypothetical protein
MNEPSAREMVPEVDPKGKGVARSRYSQYRYIAVAGVAEGSVRKKRRNVVQWLSRFLD